MDDSPMVCMTILQNGQLCGSELFLPLTRWSARRLGVRLESSETVTLQCGFCCAIAEVNQHGVKIIAKSTGVVIAERV